MRMHARYMANGGRLYHMPGMLHALYGPWMRQDHMPGSYRPAGMDYTRWHAWTVPQFLVPCLWVYQAAIVGPREGLQIVPRIARETANIDPEG